MKTVPFNDMLALPLCICYFDLLPDDLLLGIIQLLEVDDIVSLQVLSTSIVLFLL